MTVPQRNETRELARQMVLIERLAKQQQDRGDFTDADQTWQRRDEIRDRRSSLLRLAWREAEWRSRGDRAS